LATLPDIHQIGWFRFDLGHPSKAKASTVTIADSSVFEISNVTGADL
jgi:hypothetical protein